MYGTASLGTAIPSGMPCNLTDAADLEPFSHVPIGVVQTRRTCAWEHTSVAAAEEGPHRAAGLRLAHLTTIDLSLALLLRGELEVDTTLAGHVRAVGTGQCSRRPRRGRHPRRDPTPDPLVAAVGRRTPAAVDLWRVLRRLEDSMYCTPTTRRPVYSAASSGGSLGVPVVVNTCHGLWATGAGTRS